MGAENYRIPFSVIPLNWLAKLLSPYVYGCVVFISCEKLEHMLSGKRLCHYVLLAWSLAHNGYSNDCWMKEVHKVLENVK